MKRVRHWIGSDAAGFTMAEVLTVIVLVGVLLSMATPSMAAWVARSRAQRALDQVVADIAYTRMYAIQSGQRTAVRMMGDGVYTIETLETSGSWTPLRTVRLGDDYSNLTLRSGVPALEFSSRGMLVGGSGETILTVRLGEHGDSAFVSPAGRVYRDY